MLLRTSRLTLRPFGDQDLAPFAALNADPVVMEFLPAVLTTAESAALVARIRAHWDKHGFGLWAVHAPDGMVGFTGLSIPRFEAAFTPCVEVGWRLARSAWGHGYASEAARAVIAEGFGRLKLGEIVSFTATANVRSQKVMERLGMTRSPAEDFDHPSLPEGHRLRRHVLYRLKPPTKPPELE